MDNTAASDEGDLDVTDTSQAEAHRVELIGHTDLDGFGDCCMVQVVDDVAYVAHMGSDGKSTSIVDVGDPTSPRPIAHLEAPPGTRSHKLAVVGDVMVVNCERNPFAGPGGTRGTPDSWTPGLRVYDVSDRTAPVEIGFLETPGDGVHRMSYVEDPYVYMCATDEGYTGRFFQIVDVSDPSRPVEVGRWWMPGMHTAGGETPTWDEGRDFKLHHPLIRGDRAYAGWWDGGLVVLDISDVTRPRLVSHLDFGADVSARTHTALPLPGRDVLVVTDEADHDAREKVKRIRTVDITDETDPRVLATLPVPEGDYADRPGWFGPHNLHEMRPGTFVSDHIVHATYFNAGLRIYDVSDAARPEEIAHFVPPPPTEGGSIQLNDLTVTADGTIFATDRSGGGLYVLSSTI